MHHYQPVYNKVPLTKQRELKKKITDSDSSLQVASPGVSSDNYSSSVPTSNIAVDEIDMVRDSGPIDDIDTSSTLPADDNDGDDDDENETPVKTVSVSETPSVVSQPVAAPSVDFDENPEVLPDIKSFWPQYLDFLMQERPNIGSFLSLAYANPEGKCGISLKFAPTYKFQYLEITKKNNREEIERLLEKFIKRKVELHITVETKPVSGNEQNYIKTIGNIRSTIDDEIEKEPIIKTVLDYFDGEVLD